MSSSTCNMQMRWPFQGLYKNDTLLFDFLCFFVESTLDEYFLFISIRYFSL